MAKVKKAQAGAKATADSTGYYSKKVLKAYGEKDFSGAKKASDDVARQSKKGKPGYDANGFPVKKKMKSGGALKPVAPSKKKSLGQLPEAVRNQMGYQKDGGKVAEKKMQYGGKAASMVPKKAMSGMKMKAKSGMHMMPDGSMMKNSMMKSGGSAKKCKYGCK